MANNIQVVNELSTKLASKLDIGISDGLVDVLKNTAFKKGNASIDQLAALLIVSNQYSLNPWTNEIYAFPDKNNGIVPVVGVDGWARIINSNPNFDGMEFEQTDESCTCKIYRKDRGHPIAITEFLSECKRSIGPWQSHPKRMLRHKAMIQCARLAFGFTGIYEQDEAERIIESPNVIDVTPKTEQLEQPEKEVLVRGTNLWDRAIISLQKTGSLETVKKHVTILPEDEKDLYRIAGIQEQEVIADDIPL